MIDVIKALIPIINTALMCVILNLINARKSRRIRQFPLVVFSFISMIIAIPVIIKNYDRIEKIIGFVSPPFTFKSGYRQYAVDGRIFCDKAYPVSRLCFCF